jgi:hypothetical protein
MDLCGVITSKHRQQILLTVGRLPATLLSFTFVPVSIGVLNWGQNTNVALTMEVH